MIHAWFPLNQDRQKKKKRRGEDVYTGTSNVQTKGILMFAMMVSAFAHMQVAGAGYFLTRSLFRGLKNDTLKSFASFSSEP